VALPISTIAALGVVFGDIGTSPLYAFKECLRVRDAENNILGATQVVPILSLIIWSLIFVVMVKYVLLVMEANEDGEGGIMTLVSLASSKDKEKNKRKHRSVLVLLGVALYLVETYIPMSPPIKVVLRVCLM
jgi:KUP system potassium uptake protein